MSIFENMFKKFLANPKLKNGAILKPKTFYNSFLEYSFGILFLFIFIFFCSFYMVFFIISTLIILNCFCFHVKVSTKLWSIEKQQIKWISSPFFCLSIQWGSKLWPFIMCIPKIYNCLNF
jgi:hypothetical protein